MAFLGVAGVMTLAGCAIAYFAFAPASLRYHREIRQGNLVVAGIER